MKKEQKGAQVLFFTIFAYAKLFPILLRVSQPGHCCPRGSDTPLMRGCSVQCRLVGSLVGLHPRGNENAPRRCHVCLGARFLPTLLRIAVLMVPLFLIFFFICFCPSISVHCPIGEMNFFLIHFALHLSFPLFHFPLGWPKLRLCFVLFLRLSLYSSVCS